MGCARRLRDRAWLPRPAPVGGRELLILLAAVVAVLSSTRSAAAAEPTGDDQRRGAETAAPRDSDLAWHPGWPSVGLGEYVIIATAAASIAITSVIGPVGKTRRGGILVDEDVRDSLRLHSFDSRRRARETSDVMLTLSSGYPLLMDALLVAGWHHDRPDVAWNMAVIDLETMAVVASLQRLMNIVVHRERPFGRLCGTELDAKSRDCDTNDRFYSTFSGHASQTFTRAALTCSHHANLPLYGGGPVEALPCVAGFTLATLTGALRIASDRHYLSDVLLGATVGTTAGFVIPWFYYGHSRPGDGSGRGSQGWSATVVPTPTGLLVQGAF